MKETTQQEWVNWSGSLRFTPGMLAEPESEDELAEVIRRAAAEGRTVWPVEAGHSSSPLVRTRDVLVSLDRMTGMVSHDSDAQTATFEAGTYLEQVGPELHDKGLALQNYGDVDFQALAGAVGTGTHGTGNGIGSFSSMVCGARLMSATGEVVEVGQDDLEVLRAVRVSLGALGVFTELQMSVVPAFRLHRRE